MQICVTTSSSRTSSAVSCLADCHQSTQEEIINVVLSIPAGSSCSGGQGAASPERPVHAAAGHATPALHGQRQRQRLLRSTPVAAPAAAVVYCRCQSTIVAASPKLCPAASLSRRSSSSSIGGSPSVVAAHRHAGCGLGGPPFAIHVLPPRPILC